MKNKITHFAVAASILLVAGLLVWPFSPQKGQKNMLSSLTLLTEAHAAEQSVFSGRGIVYLVNEFTLTPVPENTKFSKRLEELENALAKNDMEANTKNIEALKAWFSFSWFPFYSLGADGQLKCHKVEPVGANSCVVTEKIWYDPATGRFIRLMETDGKIVFANSFDGQNVCSSYDNAGILNIRKQLVDTAFRIPENPADFLGMGVGVTNAFSRKNNGPPVVDVSQDTLEDQTPVRVYKMGFVDIEGWTTTYYLFKVGLKDNIAHEIQCVVENQPTMNLKRISTQSVSAPDLSWDLKELDEKKASVNTMPVVIRSDLENRHVSAEQMVQTADFETYLFSANPDWTSESQIHSGPDEGSDTSRGFNTIYPAKDGRPVILSQMQSLTRYHSGIHKKMEEMGHPWPPSYTSPNGCTMYRCDEKTTKWWTEFAIKASGFEPVENRCGVIIKTPAETYLALAVNGPVSNEEFHKLVDSLVPAREYQKH